MVEYFIFHTKKTQVEYEEYAGVTKSEQHIKIPYVKDPNCIIYFMFDCNKYECIIYFPSITLTNYIKIRILIHLVFLKFS